MSAEASAGETLAFKLGGPAGRATAARLRKRAAGERRWAKATLWAGIAIVVVIAFVCFAGPLLGFADPNQQNLTQALRPPSLEHPFGTDTLGRDILTRVVYGGRIDLTFAVVMTLIPFVLGALVGAIAGYRGGWLDTVVNRLVDTVVAFPFIVLILAIVTITGPGLEGAYIGVFAVGWALYARMTRGEMLVEREREYIFAARTLGYSTPRIVFRHALPNVIRASIVFSMADIVLNILLLSSLSYLGLGATPPSPEWGALVAEGKDVLLTAWWVATLPGLVIVLVGIGFSLIGDGIADRFGRDFSLTGGE
ncbi:MAG TPA: ABC transporter permease [Solirubrobacterales bacterium]|nr:ABC transporter permease [Solirubrobacterales bacterium]